MPANRKTIAGMARSYIRIVAVPPAVKAAMAKEGI